MRTPFLVFLLAAYATAACKEESVMLPQDDEDGELIEDSDALALAPQLNDRRLPVVQVGNIVTGGELHAAKVVGSCLDDEGVQSVEVKVDDAPYAPAEGTLAWSFALPRGDGAWRQGAVHAISVRCLDMSGNASVTANLVVRQGPRRDVNGDGFPDLVVGAPSAPQRDHRDEGRGFEAAGRLYLVFGKAQGLGSIGPSTERADSVVYGDGAFWRLGTAVALGDFDADGFADVVASEPGFDGGKGRVVVIAGRPGLSSEATLGELEAQLVSGHSTTGSLGAELAVADFNDDGFDDLAIAQSSSPGRVFVFLGSEQGLGGGERRLTTRNADTTLIGTSPRFGASLSGFDFDRDGLADLGVGEPGAAAGGRISIYSGTPAGLGRSVRHVLYYDHDEEAFGERVVLGDFDGDLTTDVAATVASGAPDSADGRVIVVSGKTLAGAAELDVGKAVELRRAVVLTGKAGTSFGRSLAATDLDRDGASDLVIGAPAHDNGRGRVYVFEGDERFFSVKATTKQRIDAHFSGSDAAEQLGSAMGVGVDFNHDGQPDLVLGSPRYSAQTRQRLGRIYVLYPTSGGFVATAMAGTVADGAMSGDEAGLSLGAALP